MTQDIDNWKNEHTLSTPPIQMPNVSQVWNQNRKKKRKFVTEVLNEVWTTSLTNTTTPQQHNNTTTPTHLQHLHLHHQNVKKHTRCIWCITVSQAMACHGNTPENETINWALHQYGTYIHTTPVWHIHSHILAQKHGIDTTKLDDAGKEKTHWARASTTVRLNHCPHCFCAPCVTPTFLQGLCDPHPANAEKRHRLYKLFWRCRWGRGVLDNEGAVYWPPVQ